MPSKELYRKNKEMDAYNNSPLLLMQKNYQKKLYADKERKMLQIFQNNQKTSMRNITSKSSQQVKSYFGFDPNRHRSTYNIKDAKRINAPSGQLPPLKHKTIPVTEQTLTSNENNIVTDTKEFNEVNIKRKPVKLRRNLKENRSNNNSPNVHTPNAPTRRNQYNHETVLKPSYHETHGNISDHHVASPVIHRRLFSENEENSFHQNTHSDSNSNFSSSYSPAASFSPSASRKVHHGVSTVRNDDEPIAVDESIPSGFSLMRLKRKVSERRRELHKTSNQNLPLIPKTYSDNNVSSNSSPNSFNPSKTKWDDYEQSPVTNESSVRPLENSNFDGNKTYSKQKGLSDQIKALQPELNLIVNNLDHGRIESSLSFQSNADEDTRFTTKSVKQSPLNRSRLPSYDDSPLHTHRTDKTVPGPEEEYAPVSLVSCDICGRKFGENRIAKHRNVCVKSTKKQRKVFNMSNARKKGTDLENFNAPPPSNRVKQIAQKKKNWRTKHEDFINSIRYAKEVTTKMKQGLKASDLPPPPPSKNPDYVQCPHCERRFNQKAADRHIPKCKDIKAKPRALKKRDRSRR